METIGRVMEPLAKALVGGALLSSLRRDAVAPASLRLQQALNEEYPLNYSRMPNTI